MLLSPARDQFEGGDDDFEAGNKNLGGNLENKPG